MAVTFEFDQEKTVAAVVYLASKGLPGLTKYKVCKLLFLADKYHLVRYGRPITGDRLNAMEHGPIPSRTLDILTSVIKEDFDGWMGDATAKMLAGYLEVQRVYYNPRFRAAQQPPAGILSDSDMAAIDAIVREHGNKTFEELKAMTHELYAYQKAWSERTNNAPIIAYEDLFEEDDDALEGAREEMLENHQLRKAFGNTGI